MISLFIDTSTKRLIIWIYHNNKQNYYNCEKKSNDLSSKVLPCLKKTLESIKLTCQDIDNIYVVNGPGSFTGIRVGVTIAKTLAWSLNKKIFPVSELMLLATTDTEKNYIVPMIDARRGYVYGAIYDKNQQPILKDCYIKLEELKNKVDDLCSIDNACFVSYDAIDNSIIPNISVEKLFKKEFKDINPHSLNPNYLKKTEAEEKLNQWLMN